MTCKPPHVVVVAGPNGAGKSTVAPLLLKGALGVSEFVNMDVIAEGLSAFEPERVSLTAGKIMLARLRELARQRVSFAFETTLASRSFVPWIRSLISEGYRFHVLFLWLPNADYAVARVAGRIRMGGHSVPEDTIRRRYESGLRNFFTLYRPLSTIWRVYDNSGRPLPRLIAAGAGGRTTKVTDRPLRDSIRRGLNGES
jgi:predicted ABC-type ATPase